MQYLIAFPAGIPAFLPPCLLPSLPMYAAYFIGGGKRSIARTLADSLGFAAGFAAVFMALGVLTGAAGGLRAAWRRPAELVSGSVVIAFGLNDLGLFRWNLFREGSRMLDGPRLSVFSAFLFGAAFSLGWTPGARAFPGPALLRIFRRDRVLRGMGMLFARCAELCVPLLVGAVLIDTLKNASDWVRRHYRTIHCISGSILMIMGVLTAAGIPGRLSERLQSGGIG